MDKQILIVLVTYNSENFVEKCLFSIANQNYRNYFLIVVDNNSNDNTVEIIKAYKNAEVRFSPQNFEFVKLNKNIGFARAVNYAVFNCLLKYERKKANFDYILFLNPDTLLDANCIVNLIKIFDADLYLVPKYSKGSKVNKEINNPDRIDSKATLGKFSIGAEGGLILDYNSNEIQNMGGKILDNFVTLHETKPERIDINKILNNDEDYCNNFSNILYPEYITGAFFMTRFNLFINLRGFDEGYRPAYFEELDYCIKLKRLGLKIALNPCAFVRHYEGASSYKFSRNFYYFYHKNRIRCAIINTSFVYLCKIFFYHEPIWLKANFTKDQLIPLIKAYLINLVFFGFNYFIKLKNYICLKRVSRIYNFV